MDQENEKAQHTPGPWKIHAEDPHLVMSDGNGDIRQFIARASLRYIGMQPGSADWNETTANAELIARAPEMDAEIQRLRTVNAELVAALEAVLQTFNVPKEIDPLLAFVTIEKVRAALEKARQTS